VKPREWVAWAVAALLLLLLFVLVANWGQDRQCRNLKGTGSTSQVAIYCETR
jgi:uncharacterized integral membrane protein